MKTALNDLKQSEQTLKNCNFVKTVLMILVILGHACAFWTGTWFTEDPAIRSQGLGLISSFIGAFHIYAFTLVLGYIFAFKVAGGGYGHYGSFLRNKAKRLLIPYAFVMLIWVAPISEFYFRWEPATLIKNYILCISPSQLWFMWMLFGVFAIVWPLRRVMMEKPVMGYAISLIFYGIGIIGDKFIPNVFCIWTACRYIIFFFIGMRIRMKHEDQKKCITERVPWYGWVIAYISLFVISTLAGRQSGTVWRLMTIGLNLLLPVTGAIMGWTVLQALASCIRWQDSKMFKKLSSCSMPMYLFHQQIIYVTIAVLNGIVNPWINAGVNFLVAVAGSLAISALLMRWKFTRFLIGEKA